MRYLSAALACFLGLASAGACSSSGDADPAAVTFANFQVSGLDAHRVDIQFDTSVPTSCLLRFGTTMSLGSEAVDPDMEEGETASAHDVPIEDLVADTTYYYLAEVTTAEGEMAQSETRSFRTLAASDSTSGQDNVALLSAGTTIVDVSSNYGGGANDSSWGINNAFDGSMSTEWSSNFDGSDAFVEIDFGQPRELSTFAFRSRKMNDGTSITTELQVIAGDTTLGPFQTPDPDTRYVFNLDAPVSAQQVRIEYLDGSGGNMGAKEIEFYEAP